MLLLSYLIRLNRKWSKSEINIYSITATEEEKILMQRHIKFSIHEARIDAKIHVSTTGFDKPLETLIGKSKNADLVFTGLARQKTNYETRVEIIDTLVSELKSVVFVQNNGMENDIPVIFRFDRND